MNRYADTVHGIMRAMRLHRSACESRLSELKIHHTQHRLLMHLSKNDGVPSQKELARHFNVSPAAITGSLKKLEAGGYIRRTQASRDLRINGIEITELGRETVKRSREIFEAIDCQMFDGFDEAELESFNRCLDKIRNNMEVNR